MFAPLTGRVGTYMITCAITDSRAAFFAPRSVAATGLRQPRALCPVNLFAGMT